METFAAILTSTGKWTLLDVEDFRRFSPFNWYAEKNNSDSHYVARHDVTKERGRDTVKLHREILGAKKGEFVDHINHDTLDNRRANLRIATARQNQMNRRKNKGGSSNFKGVYKHAAGGFVAQLTFKSKVKYLGYFKKEKDAAQAYDLAATKYFGEFANLNFKGDK